MRGSSSSYPAVNGDDYDRGEEIAEAPPMSLLSPSLSSSSSSWSGRELESSSSSLSRSSSSPYSSVTVGANLVGNAYLEVLSAPADDNDDNAEARLDALLSSYSESVRYLIEGWFGTTTTTTEDVGVGGEGETKAESEFYLSLSGNKGGTKGSDGEEYDSDPNPLSRITGYGFYLEEEEEDVGGGDGGDDDGGDID